MKNTPYRYILILALILTPFLSVYREKMISASMVVSDPKTDRTAPVEQNTVLGASETLSATSTAILTLTNDDRGVAGLAPLKEQWQLMMAAKERAEFLCGRPFSHNSDGSTPWDSFRNVGYPYIFAGENLADGYSNPDQVELAFMASPEHRDNILGKNYTEFGVGWSCGRVVVLFGNE